MHINEINVCDWNKKLFIKAKNEMELLIIKG